MTRSLLIASLLTVSLSLGLTAAPAVACGDLPRAALAQAPSLEDEARAVVDEHFGALARGDARAVRALWDRKAKVVSRDADGKRTRTRKLARALPRWIAEREGLTWTVGAVALRFDRTLVVHATVTWNGAVYDDVMTVELDGGARILGKTSTARRVDTRTKETARPTFAY